MSKIIVVNVNALSNVENTIELAKQVNAHRFTFLKDIHDYTSNELAVIECSLSLGHVMGCMSNDVYAEVLGAITYERNTVRKENR
jgi:hypothetical protein